MKEVYSYHDIIKRFNMKPLPEEGGFYVETFRSLESVELPMGRRSVGTAIFYLITASHFSALHCLKFPEIYHFYQGDPVTILQITKGGLKQEVTLGHDMLTGQIPQTVIPGNVWQGSKIKNQNLGWSLIGTTMSPGFDFADFELGDREVLINAFPHLIDDISKYTRVNL